MRAMFRSWKEEPCWESCRFTMLPEQYSRRRALRTKCSRHTYATGRPKKAASKLHGGAVGLKMPRRHFAVARHEAAVFEILAGQRACFAVCIQCVLAPNQVALLKLSRATPN